MPIPKNEHQNKIVESTEGEVNVITDLEIETSETTNVLKKERNKQKTDISMGEENHTLREEKSRRNVKQSLHQDANSKQIDKLSSTETTATSNKIQRDSTIDFSNLKQQVGESKGSVFGKAGVLTIVNRKMGRG